MIKYSILLCSLFIYSTLALADNIKTSAPIFAGKYRCKGFDPYLNENYTGTVTVTHENAVYQLEMDYDTGERSIGTGGQYDSKLMSVVFQDRKNLKNIGLEQYEFSPDKKVIQGFWVYLGKDKLGVESCEKIQ